MDGHTPVGQGQEKASGFGCFFHKSKAKKGWSDFSAVLFSNLDIKEKDL